MKTNTLIGLIAAALTTVSFVPQVVRTWRMKETRDISLMMFVILGIGIILWIVYGILIRDLPVILANLITFVFVAVIIFFKVRYK